MFWFSSSVSHAGREFTSSAQPRATRAQATCHPRRGRLPSARLALILRAPCARAADIYIIATSSLTKPNYSETSVEQLRNWRRNIAHDIKYFDVISESSLARRVCDRDLSLEVSTNQVQIVNETYEYLKLNNNLGKMMCTLALLAWYLTLSQELASAVTTIKVTASLAVL